jgi:hypothetical protein
MAEVYDSESHLQESTTKLQLTCGNTNVLSHPVDPAVAQKSLDGG